MEKICPKCEVLQPLEDFTRRRGKPDSWCRACNDAKWRRWEADHPQYAKNRKSRWKELVRPRAEYVLAEKQKPCADCGGTFHPVAMDFDHVRGEKLNEVSTLLRTGSSLETLKAEIAKCDVVCSNCHRVRTFTRKGDHGPYSIYGFLKNE